MLAFEVVDWDCLRDGIGSDDDISSLTCLNTAEAILKLQCPSTVDRMHREKIIRRQIIALVPREDIVSVDLAAAKRPRLADVEADRDVATFAMKPRHRVSHVKPRPVIPGVD